MLDDQLEFFEVCSRYPKTDKVSYHGYHRSYPYFLSRLRGQLVSMLEIGVARGGSLEFWRDYFKELSYWGVDIRAEEDIQEVHPEIFIIRGDQSDAGFLELLPKKINKELNFIIDDGSHVPDHQINTFNSLFFSLLAPGGVYIIEDIETSYWKRDKLYGYSINYGVGHPKSVIEIFKSIVDSVNLEFTNGELYSPESSISHKVQREIELIAFSHNSIIIIKKDRAAFAQYYDRIYRGAAKV